MNVIRFLLAYITQAGQTELAQEISNMVESIYNPTAVHPYRPEVQKKIDTSGSQS